MHHHVFPTTTKRRRRRSDRELPRRGIGQRHSAKWNSDAQHFDARNHRARWRRARIKRRIRCRTTKNQEHRGRLGQAHEKSAKSDQADCKRNQKFGKYCRKIEKNFLMQSKVSIQEQIFLRTTF